MHISAEKLHSTAHRTLSAAALRCSFFNQTALLREGLTHTVRGSSGE